MKSTIQYLLFFGAMFLLSSTVVAALLLLKPKLFHGQWGGAQSPAAAAESVVPQGAPTRSVAGPTLAELQGPEPVPAVVHDSVVELKDSLQALAAQLQQERRKPAAPDTQRTAVDTVKARERKIMAKLLESMPPENAARILQDLSDAEMKEILLNIKKRQAAKIMSSIEPSRASKLFR